MCEHNSFREVSLFRLFQLIVSLPGYVFWLFCLWAWEIDVFNADKLHPIYSTIFYSGVGLAGLLSIVCGVLIVIHNEYLHLSLFAWYIIAQTLAVGWFIARGMVVGIPRMGDTSGNLLAALLFWIVPLLLPSYIYVWSRKLLFESNHSE